MGFLNGDTGLILGEPQAPTGSGGITGGSVQGDGSGGNPIELVNDNTSPGNNYFYGTDSGGTKGWFPVPGATQILIFPYGGANPLGPINADVNFSGGAGATTVQFDPLSPIGTEIIVSDLDAICSLTNSITADAGAGNFIIGFTVSQFFVLSQPGESILFKRIDATRWKAQ